MKLKAFTISEIMVVMIITGVVIMIGQRTYVTTVKLQHNYATQEEGNLERAKLSYLLEKDMFESKYVLNNQQALTFLKANEAVQYSIKRNHVIRHQNAKVDSFYLEAFSSEFEYATEKKVLVNEFSIKAQDEVKNWRIAFRKDYATQDLMLIDKIGEQYGY